MGQLAERLENIHVRVRAPGVDMEAELRARTTLSLRFEEGVYEFISEQALKDSLSKLARLLYTGWQRQYREAIDETGLNIDPDDQHDYNFFAERDQVECVGESSDGRIRLSSTGMAEFSVELTPGTVRELTEHAFTAGVAEAGGALIRDFQDKVGELQMRYYG